MTDENKISSEHQNIIDIASNAIDVKQKAQNVFTKDVEYALYVKNKSIAKTEKELSDILNKYKDSAFAALKARIRYIPDTKGVVNQPDRMFVEKDGIRLEWDWEDRGYTENLSILSEWQEIFEKQTSE